jgi:tRNA (guanine-N7-)-methyltransferase
LRLKLGTHVSKSIHHPIVVDPQVFQDQSPEALINRPIRSFALRGGHMSSAQKLAYETGMPRWSINYQNKTFDFNQQFVRPAPLILEIGFGMGETTARIAQALPQFNFIALEVYTAGVGSLLKLIDQKNLTNLRVMQHDAVEVLTHMVAANSLAGVHIFFPDPWHKARHNKRRLIQAPFMALLASRLQIKGYIHCATDWEAYAQQMLAVMSSEPLLQNTSGSFCVKPDYRPQTKFETRGLKLGHGVWDLLFERIATTSA